MNNKDKHRAHEYDVDKFCDILNRAFAYPFMPKGFVKVSPSPYPNGIRLQIGSRDVSFTFDGEFIGQGTGLPEAWTITSVECYSCGSTDNLTYGTDPYASEIKNDHREMWLCDDCTYESKMDI